MLMIFPAIGGDCAEEEVASMCQVEKKCEKGKDPETCTPEQIKECHGDTAGHPCEAPASKQAK